MQSQLRKLCQLLPIDKNKSNLKIQESPLLRNQKQFTNDEVKKLQINDNIHYIISVQEALNKQQYHQQIKKPSTKFHKIRQQKLSSKKRNIPLPIIHQLKITKDLHPISKSKQLNCQERTLQLINKSQRHQSQQIQDLYEKLIEEYIQKIKNQNLMLKYSSREELIKDACQNIQLQILAKPFGTQRKKLKPEIHNQNLYYLEPKRKGKRQVLSVPAFYQKGKRGKYGSIGSASLIHDLQMIKKNQLLLVKQRQIQERLFLRKMKMHGIFRQKAFQNIKISTDAN